MKTKGSKDKHPRQERRKEEHPRQNYEAVFNLIIETARMVMRDLQTDRFYPAHLVAHGVPYSEVGLRKVLHRMVQEGIVCRVGQRRGWQLI